MNTIQKVLFVLMVIVIVGILGTASRYLSLEVTGLLQTKDDELLANPIYLAGFFGHVIFGMLALLLGPAQFLKGLRRKTPKLHRWVGRIYIFACFGGGLTGFYIAFYATTGIIAQLGFTGLAIAWLYTTSKALLAIRKRQIQNHRNWMIRSFSLTFAAVTLRIYLGFFLTLGFEFYDIYPIIAWLCWLPNLLMAEFTLVKGTLSTEQ